MKNKTRFMKQFKLKSAIFVAIGLLLINPCLIKGNDSFSGPMTIAETIEQASKPLYLPLPETDEIKLYDEKEKDKENETDSRKLDYPHGYIAIV